LNIGDIGSVKSWRKIFLVEGETLRIGSRFCHSLHLAKGIITTGIGLLCFVIIPTDPQHTRMLTAEEKALALARIDADQVVRTHGRKEATTLKLIWKSFNVNVSVPHTL
jgi:hypothetical protein